MLGVAQSKAYVLGWMHSPPTPYTKKIYLNYNIIYKPIVFLIFCIFADNKIQL